MNKLSILFLFSLVFTTTTVIAQVGTSTGTSTLNRDDNEEIMNQYLKGIKKNADPSDNIAGTPYLEEEFKSAVLVFPKNDALKALVRYNVAKEEMQVKFDENGYRILHPSVVVKLKNTPFKMLTYRGEDKSVDLIGYFEVLTPGTEEGLTLLRKNTKTVKRGKAAAAMQKATPPRYVDKDDFYIQFADSKPVMVERRTKKFINLFPEEHQDEVKDYMKENNLKSKDEQDLRNIVNFYNRTF